MRIILNVPKNYQSGGSLSSIVDKTDAAIRASKIAKIESHCILLTFLLVVGKSGSAFSVALHNPSLHLTILAFEFFTSGFFGHFLVPFLSMAIYSPSCRACQHYNFVML